MIHESAYGRLGRDLKAHKTRKRQTMETTSVACGACRGDDEQTLWLQVISFGSAGEALDPSTLAGMVTDGITSHMDMALFAAMLRQEKHARAQAREPMAGIRSLRE